MGTHWHKGYWQEMTKDRFLSLLIKRKNGCWEWHKPGKYGYGVVWYKNKNWQAHRLAYHLLAGKIPKNKMVCHSCDNKPCCNPTHLWLGSARDNVVDMINKGRKAPTHGELSAMAKLNNYQIRAIRKYHSKHSKTRIWGCKKMALKYKVSREEIGRIVRGLNWKHI